MHTPSPRIKTAIGLDFGTSNSTVGIDVGKHPSLVALENDHVTVPSAVFFGTEKEDAFLIGRAAVNAYVDGSPGRLMRSLKSILGSSLIEERTPIHRHIVPFSQIITRYIAELKRRAEVFLDRDVESVVVGRPVQFVDDDDVANMRAEQTLGKIAQAVGFKHVSFQYEPVAAALDFERQLTCEKLALIADIGGGTSDFSVVRLGAARRKDDRSNDVLANAGIRVGGTDYDRTLSMAQFMPNFGYGSMLKRGDIEVPSAPFWDLSTWSSIHKLYDAKRAAELRTIRYSAQKPELIDRLIKLVGQRRGHGFLMEVERTKIALSDSATTVSDLGVLDINLQLTVNQATFETSAEALYEKLRRTVLSCVARAGLTAQQIEVIFFTGGTSMIPSVRRAVTSNFSQATIVDGDQFGSVGLGLGMEAKLRFG
jgi:hypothetical chaperone protein